MLLSPLLKVLSFALLPVGAMLAGGGFALWRVPNAAWRSAILHFAAGVVFSVVAVELLPDIVQQHKPFEVALGFGGGVAAMRGLRGSWGMSTIRSIRQILLSCYFILVKSRSSCGYTGPKFRKGKHYVGR